MIEVLNLARAISSCGKLWFQARMMGVRVNFRELVRMKLRKIDVKQVVILLIEAHAAGVAVSLAEVEQADLQRVDLKRITKAIVEAHRQGMHVTFQELVDAP